MYCIPANENKGTQTYHTLKIIHFVIWDVNWCNRLLGKRLKP